MYHMYASYILLYVQRAFNIQITIDPFIFCVREFGKLLISSMLSGGKLINVNCSSHS